MRRRPAVAQQGAKADAPPTFQPEPFWPKPLPENWALGFGRRVQKFKLVN